MQRDLFRPSPSDVLSRDLRYRYRLDWPIWDAGGRVVWMLHNPSTATAEQTDPTLLACIDFSRLWSYGSLTLVNFCAIRSSNPDDLLGVEDPVGPDNARHIQEAASGADRIVIAHGNVHPKLLPHLRTAHALLGRHPLFALGFTAAGSTPSIRSPGASIACRARRSPFRLEVGAHDPSP